MRRTNDGDGRSDEPVEPELAQDPPASDPLADPAPALPLDPDPRRSRFSPDPSSVVVDVDAAIRTAAPPRGLLLPDDLVCVAGAIDRPIARGLTFGDTGPARVSMTLGLGALSDADCAALDDDGTEPTIVSSAAS